MKRFFHLGTCSTCKRIIADLNPESKGYAMQDIKTDAITTAQLEEMANLAGSYEALFSRRAMKFRAMGLHEKELSEADFKSLILEEYTFLKRPVLVNEKAIFIGSAKQTIAEALASM